MMRRLSTFVSTLLLAAVLVGGLWIHAWNIGSIPLGLYSDEASVGLNASMIERFQTDEFGTPWPLFFEAFGEFKNPIYIYTAAALLKLFPLSDTVLRGVSFLFFGGALTLWAWLSLSIFRSRWTAVWTTAALALVPWLYTLSRVSFEAISYVFIYVALLLVVVHLFIQGKRRFLSGILLGLLAGVAWYTYSTARLLIPLFIINVLIVSWGKGSWRSMLGMLLGGSILAVPVYFLLQYQPDVLLGRFETLTYIYDPATSTWDKVVLFVQNYISYFGPDYHLLHGDPNLRHHTGVGGMAYQCLYILMWLGMGRYLFQGILSYGLYDKKREGKKKKKEGREGKWQRKSVETFMFLELVTAPIAASLTEPSHTIRVITMIIPVLFFAGYGLEVFRRKQLSLFFATVTLVASILLASEAHAFLSHATKVYPYVSARSFYTFGLDKAINTVREKGYPLLSVEPSLNDAVVISNYYSLVTGNTVYVTTLPDRYTKTVLSVPHCVLNRKKPYEMPVQTILPPGAEQIFLDVRSTLSLVCYPHL